MRVVAGVLVLLIDTALVVAFVVAVQRWAERTIEGRPRTAAARARAVRDHAARRQLEVAHEQLRLRVEARRHLQELAVEMEHERRRRELEGPR